MTKPRRGSLPGALSFLCALAAGTAPPSFAAGSPVRLAAPRASASDVVVAPCRGHRLVPAAGFAPASAGSSPRRAAAQAPFDQPAVLAVVARASALWRDPPPVAYLARAQSRVYFYLDREDGGDPVPLRIDQAVVDVYRGADGVTRQIVRAQRRRELLPVRDFEYYLDRLTIVPDGYGEQIEIGQGLDVRSVPHPLGRSAAALYRYRLADSVTMRLPRADAPVRVYEVQVEPRRPDRPAFVGSLFVERETGALARMEFTFTPSAYVDPRSDYVRVVLEHALWDEGYWLPYRQRIEVRREQPGLDLPFGSVIRAVLQVASYDLQPRVEPELLLGPRVSFAPPEEGQAAAFDGGLMDELAGEGLTPVSLARLETEVRAAARTRLAGRLPRLRLHADRFSSVLRANRAEGLHLGLGASFSPSPAWPKLEAVGGAGGLAGRGARRVSATLRGTWTAGGAEWRAEAFARQPRDLGPLPGAPGLVNTVAAVFGRDYADPWFAHGWRAGAQFGAGTDAVGRAAAFGEQHRATGQALFDAAWGGRAFRPVRAVEEGMFAGVEAEFERAWRGSGWGAHLATAATAAKWRGRGVSKLQAELELRASSANLEREAGATLGAGAAWGAVPAHMLYFLGGSGSLPGHPFRGYAGSRYVLARAEAAIAVAPGRLSARLVAGAGAASALPTTFSADPGRTAEGAWRLRATRGPKGYAGFGLGLLGNLVRADCAWGIPGGGFELVFSAAPSIADLL